MLLGLDIVLHAIKYMQIQMLFNEVRQAIIKHVIFGITVNPSVVKLMSERQFEFTNYKKTRVAMGTWNVNGGKQFRSNILSTSELTDWLLDAPKLSGLPDLQGKCALILQDPINIELPSTILRLVFFSFSFAKLRDG